MTAPLHEVVSTVGLEAIPAGMGATFARTQFGRREPKEKEQPGAPFVRDVFLILAGAVLFSLSVVPTEEMILIWFKMRPVHGILLVLLTLALIQAFVYPLQLKGREGDSFSFWEILLTHTFVAYVIAVAASAFLLWAFGRFEGQPLVVIAGQSIVLGFPSSVGAAAARLII